MVSQVCGISCVIVVTKHLQRSINYFQSGGHKCTSKNYRRFLQFELATVTSQALKYDVTTYTPYEGLNYTILDKIKPLWKRIGEPPEIQTAVTGATQVISVTRANRTIYCDWMKPLDACVTEISICFHSGWHYYSVEVRDNKCEIRMLASPY